MSQISFSDFEFAGQRKQTRHEPSCEIGQVAPCSPCWREVLKLIRPHGLQTGDGRKRPPQAPLVGQATPRPGLESKLSQRRLINKTVRKIECATSRVQVSVERPFQVIKQKSPSLTTRAPLANLWIAQKQRMGRNPLRL